MSGFPLEHIARLSAAEQSLLGQRKTLRGGACSRFSYVSQSEWPHLRRILVERSQSAAARNKPGFRLPPRMTAYTPGETLHLLEEPEILAWHSSVTRYRVPERDPMGRPLRALVLVPCAKTKPWDTARHGLYASYNRVRAYVQSGALPYVYFVTLSEPLGVVPESHWGDFPQYDNPGLFRCGAQSTGLFTADWPRVTGLPEKRLLPFDEKAYQLCIQKLGAVISSFLRAQPTLQTSLPVLSFVDDVRGSRTSHRDMLDVALSSLESPVAASFYPKKGAPRQPPAEHLASVLRTHVL